jgi:O-antigen ligase
MAATSTYLRHDRGAAAHGWIAVAVALLGLALGCGYGLAVGEIAGLYVGLSLVCAVAVLLDFRVGAVLLLLMLPTSASALFPHSLMQISGLNPLNLLILATVGSYVIHGRLQRAAGSVVPMPLIWLYIVPIVVAGFVGMGHVQEIPSFFYELGSILFFTERQYLVLEVARPLLMVVVALMLGAAAARSQKPERFIVAIALSALLIALIQLGFVVMEAPSLARLGSKERDFYEPLGMHANDLGRLHLFSFALLLFVWAETKRPNMRLFLLLTLGVVGIALLLSFSRASFAGAVLVGALLLMWKFNAKTLSLALIGLMLVVALFGDVLYSRMTVGFGEGADAVSAGRIDGIWLPLLPELAKSPVWGHGLGSILWSFPMVNDSMLRVAHPHNAYLETLLDMGVVGLILFSAFYAHVWKEFRALGGSERLAAEMRGLFQGGTAALAAFLFTCFVGSSLRPSVEAAYLWIAIGLMYGLRGRRTE